MDRHLPNPSHENMLLLLASLGSLVTLAVAAVQDACPKDEYACLDIINSSQCLAQVAIQKTPPLTRENMIKCIDYEGVASTLSPAQKVRFIMLSGRKWVSVKAEKDQFCRCPGCHTEPINAAIRELFPAPCT